MKHVQLVVQNRYLYTLSLSVIINEMTSEQHNQNNRLSNDRKKLLLVRFSYCFSAQEIIS